MDVPTDTIDGWFKVVSGQGIGLAFLSAFLLIVLVGLASAVRLGIRKGPEIVEWGIALMKSTIDLQQSLRVLLEDMRDMTLRSRRDLATIRKGNAHVINGFHALAEKHGERLGIGSDVVVHFENAAKEYERREDDERRYQRQQRDNGTE